MADYDGSPGTIGLEQAIRPSQNAGEFGSVVLRIDIRHIDDDEVHPAGAEQFIMVIVVCSIVAAVVGLAAVT